MESREEDTDEYSLIADNFPLLLEKRQRILSHPHLNKAWSPVFYLSFAYISGGSLIPIGFLFKAWDRGLMIGHCPNCDHDRQTKSFHLFNMGGSVLSGAHSAWGVCARCLGSSDFTFDNENDGILFGQRATETIALKRELEITDDFAKQWLGIESIAEVRGGMIRASERKFIGCWDPKPDSKNNTALVVMPPSLRMLVEILKK